jgi:hypothetical protein
MTERAKKIQNVARLNYDPATRKILRLEAEIRRLRGMLGMGEQVHTFTQTRLTPLQRLRLLFAWARGGRRGRRVSPVAERQRHRDEGGEEELVQVTEHPALHKVLRSRPWVRAILPSSPTSKNDGGPNTKPEPRGREGPGVVGMPKQSSQPRLAIPATSATPPPPSLGVGTTTTTSSSTTNLLLPPPPNPKRLQPQGGGGSNASSKVLLVRPAEGTPEVPPRSRNG